MSLFIENLRLFKIYLRPENVRSTDTWVTGSATAVLQSSPNSNFNPYQFQPISISTHIHFGPLNQLMRAVLCTSCPCLHLDLNTMLVGHPGSWTIHRGPLIATSYLRYQSPDYKHRPSLFYKEKFFVSLYSEKNENYGKLWR